MVYNWEQDGRKMRAVRTSDNSVVVEVYSGRAAMGEERWLELTPPPEAGQIDRDLFALLKELAAEVLK